MLVTRTGITADHTAFLLHKHAALVMHRTGQRVIRRAILQPRKRRVEYRRAIGELELDEADRCSRITAEIPGVVVPGE